MSVCLRERADPRSPARLSSSFRELLRAPHNMRRLTIPAYGARTHDNRALTALRLAQLRRYLDGLEIFEGSPRSMPVLTSHWSTGDRIAWRCNHSWCIIRKWLNSLSLRKTSTALPWEVSTALPEKQLEQIQFEPFSIAMASRSKTHPKCICHVVVGV